MDSTRGRGSILCVSLSQVVMTLGLCLEMNMNPRIPEYLELEGAHTESNSLLLPGLPKTKSYDWEKAEVWEKQSHSWACSPSDAAEILLGKARLSCHSHITHTLILCIQICCTHTSLCPFLPLFPKYYCFWGKIALLPTKPQTIHLLEGSWRRILLFLHSLPFLFNDKRNLKKITLTNMYWNKISYHHLCN